MGRDGGSLRSRLVRRTPKLARSTDAFRQSAKADFGPLLPRFQPPGDVPRSTCHDTYDVKAAARAVAIHHDTADLLARYDPSPFAGVR